MIRIRLPTLEIITTIVPRQEAHKTDNHLPKRRVHIKIKLAFEVMRAKLSKVGFIPYNDVGGTYFVETCIAGEKSVHDRCEHVEILVYEFFL